MPKCGPPWIVATCRPESREPRCSTTSSRELGARTFGECTPAFAPPPVRPAGAPAMRGDQRPLPRRVQPVPDPPAPHLAFQDVLRWQVAGRTEFERLIAVEHDTPTDLERAARFLYLQRCAFGGKVVSRSFGVSARDHLASRFDVTRLAGELQYLHERLAA